MSKYTIKHVDTFGDKQNRTFVIQVDEQPTVEQRYIPPAQVWLREGSIKCCGCSSILVGMSASCRHVKAVKRWAKGKVFDTVTKSVRP